MAECAAGLALAGKSPQSLEILEKDRRQIVRNLVSLPEMEAAGCLQAAAEKVCAVLGVWDVAEICYFKKNNGRSVAALRICLRHGDLSGVFPSPKTEKK